MTVESVVPESVDAPPRQVALAFRRDAAGRTVLVREHTAYPFHVGRALTLPDDAEGVCTSYLQSASGGIFQRDRLGIALRAEAGSAAHVTTSASTVVHSMEDDHAAQSVVLDADDGAVLEYLPEPQILFPDSRLANRLVIRAHAGATVVACDSFLPHDPAGAAAPFGWLRSDTRIEDERGALLATDRFAVDGADAMAGRVGIHGAFRMQATLLVVHRRDPDRMLDVLRAALPESDVVYAGASLLPNGAGAWLRALASDAVALRATLHEAWAAVRFATTGTRPRPRRK